MTDGTLKAQGEADQGLFTTLHYADGLNKPRDNAFREHYTKTYPKMQPDVYAVQVYDAAQLLAAGLAAVKDDVSPNSAKRSALRPANSERTKDVRDGKEVGL